MNNLSIAVEDHVIVFMDIHDCSIVLDILEKNKYSSLQFLQEVWEII